MLTHPTLDQLHQLGLAGMARAFAELEANPTSAALSHAEWLGLLLDREITERYERRLRARLRFARLRHQAAVEDVDYRAARGLDRALFQSLDRRPLDRRGAEPDHRRARPASARAGSPARSATRRAATTARSSTSASPSCSPISRWPAATAAIPG